MKSKLILLASLLGLLAINGCTPNPCVLPTDCPPAAPGVTVSCVYFNGVTQPGNCVYTAP
ncbi:MAG: hypothetical protein R3A47_12670 [Polyangiales bacterium]